MTDPIDKQSENKPQDNKQCNQEEQGRRCKECDSLVESGVYCEECKKKYWGEKSQFKKGHKVGWKKGQSGNPKGRPKVGFREAVDKAIQEIRDEDGNDLMKNIVRRAFKSDPLAIAILRKYLPDLNDVNGNITLKDIMSTIAGESHDEEDGTDESI